MERKPVEKKKPNKRARDCSPESWHMRSEDISKYGFGGHFVHSGLSNFGGGH